MNLLPASLRRNLSRVVAGVALAMAAGCSTVEVTDGTLAEFRLGELQTMVDANFDAAYAATKEAFEKQGLFLTGDDRKPVEAVLTARDRADTQVTVKLKEMTPGRTNVKIRYGLTGDAARSQALFRDMQNRL